MKNVGKKIISGAVRSFANALKWQLEKKDLF
jgi:hypothetical protein